MSALSNAHRLTKAVYILSGIVLAYSLLHVFTAYMRRRRSGIGSLPGPSSSAGFLRGNFKDVAEDDAYRLMEQWERMYGKTYAYKTMLNVSPIFSFVFKSTRR